MLSFYTLNYAIEIENPKGNEIKSFLKKASEGYIGQDSTMELILFDASGSSISKTMDGIGIETKDGSMRLLTFITPSDVKGTKLLTHSYDNSDDDQCLYLKSFKRVKRIN